MGKVSAAQKRASKKWDTKHSDRIAYINKRSAAKNFILKLATQNDIKNMEKYIKTRKDFFRNEKGNNHGL